MTTPATYNFDLVRGSAATLREEAAIIFRYLVNGVAPAFADVRISVYDKSDEQKGTLILRTDLGVAQGHIVLTDEYSGEYAWLPTADQTRLLKVGAKNFYEIEFRWAGNEVIPLRGTITGIGGINDDEDIS
jgi:hypothetical protein